MIFVTAGLIMVMLFAGWLLLRLLRRQPINGDDVVAGVFFVAVFFSLMYFLLHI